MKSLKKLFVLILSACLLLSAFAVPTHAEYDQTHFLACLENLDLIAETVMDKSMTHGVSIAVINKSDVWLIWLYGSGSENTRRCGYLI